MYYPGTVLTLNIPKDLIISLKDYEEAKSQEQVLEDRPLHQPPSLRLLTPFYSTMLTNDVPNTRDFSKPIGYTMIGVGRLTKVGLEELREEPL